MIITADNADHALAALAENKLQPLQSFGNGAQVSGLVNLVAKQQVISSYAFQHFWKSLYASIYIALTTALIGQSPCHSRHPDNTVCGVSKLTAAGQQQVNDQSNLF